MTGSMLRVTELGANGAAVLTGTVCPLCGDGFEPGQRIVPVPRFRALLDGHESPRMDVAHERCIIYVASMVASNEMPALDGEGGPCREA